MLCRRNDLWEPVGQQWRARRLEPSREEALWRFLTHAPRLGHLRDPPAPSALWGPAWPASAGAREPAECKGAGRCGRETALEAARAGRAGGCPADPGVRRRTGLGLHCQPRTEGALALRAGREGSLLGAGDDRAGPPQNLGSLDAQEVSCQSPPTPSASGFFARD